MRRTVANGCRVFDMHSGEATGMPEGGWRDRPQNGTKTRAARRGRASRYVSRKWLPGRRKGAPGPKARSLRPAGSKPEAAYFSAPTLYFAT